MSIKIDNNEWVNKKTMTFVLLNLKQLMPIFHSQKLVFAYFTFSFEISSNINVPFSESLYKMIEVSR